MSFSSRVKNEICRQTKLKPCCMAAEAYGALLFCNTFSPSEVRIVTENRAFASRIEWLVKELFGFGFDSVSGDPEGEGKLVLSVTDASHIDAVLERYGGGAEALLAHHVNLGVLEEDCCRVSFIRGAFLAGGSVTDPGKRYHLELVTSHYNVARETFSLLGELGFDPGSTSRAGNYITYFKQSSAIEDLLTTIGAPIGAMDMMTAKIEKEMRNSVNRKVNCDTANLEKMVNAAVKQVAAIEKLKGSGRFEMLSDKLKQTAEARLLSPEASLFELAGSLDPPVTKSCLSHRLAKLVELAEQG